MIIANKKIACAPPRQVAVEQEISSGFAKVKNKFAMEELEVVISNRATPEIPSLPVGTKIWVTLEALTNHKNFGHVYKHGDLKFVLVNLDQVAAFDYVEPPLYSSWLSADSTKNLSTQKL